MGIHKVVLPFTLLSSHGFTEGTTCRVLDTWDEGDGKDKAYLLQHEVTGKKLWVSHSTLPLDKNKRYKHE